MQAFITSHGNSRKASGRRPANSRALIAALLCGGSLLALHTGTASAGPLTTGTIRVHHSAGQFVSRTGDDVTLDFVAADINDVLKALAVQTGANIVASPDVKGTITVSLAHVTLEQALDMITRLSGFQYSKANNAYIVGTPSSIAAFATPTGAAQPTVTEVVPLRYATVDDVTSLVKLRFPNVQSSVGTQIAGHSAGGSTAAVILSGPQDVVEQAKTLIGSLEDSLAQRVAQETTETYSPHYASLGDMMSILNTLVPSLTVTAGPAGGFRASAPSAAAGAATSSASAAGTSSTGSSGGSGSGSGMASPGAPSPTGSSQSAMNGPTMLLMTGTQTDIQRARQILAQVDVKPVQLLFETKVTELNNNDQKNIGLNWDFSTASVTIGEVLPQGSNQNTGNKVAVDYPGHILKFGTFARTPLTELAAVSLDALIQNGQGKLLADPNIAALDGYPAQVFIGDTVNYIQSITTSTTGQNITTASVNVGVTLRVTGKVNPDGYITLNIHPEVSSISNFTPTPGGGQLPDIATRYADTTIRVKDGQTIAIGGLIQNNDINNITKVPFFGDLPFFGNFFRDSKHSIRKTEVVFFLKTSVMKES